MSFKVGLANFDLACFRAGGGLRFNVSRKTLQRSVQLIIVKEPIWTSWFNFFVFR